MGKSASVRRSPSPSVIVSPSSHPPTRGADSATEYVDDQVKDRNDYGHNGVDNRQKHGCDSRDDGVDDTTNSGKDGAHCRRVGVR